MDDDHPTHPSDHTPIRSFLTAVADVITTQRPDQPSKQQQFVPRLWRHYHLLYRIDREWDALIRDVSRIADRLRLCAARIFNSVRDAKESGPSSPRQLCLYRMQTTLADILSSLSFQQFDGMKKVMQQFESTA